MARTLSNSAMQAAMAQSTDEVWVTLLDIEHPDFPATIRVCDNTENIVSGGNTYIAFPFRFAAPSDEEEREPKATLSISNVDQSIIDDIRSILSPPIITAYAVLASSPNSIEYGPLKLKADSVNYDAQNITLQLGFDAFADEPTGWIKYSPEYFPGMFV